MSDQPLSEQFIFLQALEKPSGAERAAFLDAACGGNQQLRAAVESLLRADEKSGDLLDVSGGAAATVDHSPITERPGTVIGPYKLLEQIGEGGMGVVYMAEQQQPVRRRVALKIIKPGMDTQQVVARFEAERQALAMMEHQNIARVLDAGATDTGRPYFVMELVKGIPITEYCDRNSLTVRERLGVFVAVCRAIQHAHQKGVIHRDVKPSNVLVCLYDGKPVPKVIDFGVAKAIQQRLTERTMFTQFGQIVGTLEYMSPEQAEFNQMDIDTRSDVYSLGALLYELLTGSTPISKEQLRTAGFEEMLRLIRQQEPEKPSTRLSHSGEALPGISAQRKTEPKKLPLLVRGELDWIVMRALEKDRTRRYDSAGALASDIQRHLNDEPVEACSPSAAYRLGKFARKHRAALGTAAAFVMTLLVAAVVSAWQAVRATQAEQVAQERLEAEREALVQAESARQAESEARRQAEIQRDQTRAAEKHAKAEQARALAAQQQAQDALARSLFEQARAVRLAGQPGRRWQALELLKQAEQLRSRKRPDLPLAGDKAAVKSQPLPEQWQLCSEGVAALLLPDGRVSQQWNGYINAISPDGKFAAILDFDAQRNSARLEIVDLATARAIVRWENPEALRTSSMLLVALGPSAKRLASVSKDSQCITVWKLPELKRIRELSVPQQPQQQLPAPRKAPPAVVPEPPKQTVPNASKKTAESPNVPPQATVSARTPRADAQASGKTQAGTAKSVDRGMVQTMLFSPDGTRLAAVRGFPGSEADVILWNLEGDPQGRVIATASTMPTLAAAFSPDSRRLAFPSSYKQVTVYNIAEKRVDREIQLPLATHGPVGFSSDSRLLGILGLDPEKVNKRQIVATSTLLIWDVVEDREVLRLHTALGLAAGPIAFAPGGRRVAVGGMSGTIHVFDLDTQATLLQFDHGENPQLLAWDSDGRRLISGAFGSLKVWQFAGEPPLSTLRLATTPVAGLGLAGPFGFSPDGRWVAAETLAGRLALLDRNSGAEVRTFDTRDPVPFAPRRLLFSPDGRLLVRLGFDRLLAWDVDTGKEQVRFDAEIAQGKLFWSVGFRADGKLAAGGSVKSQLAVWEAASGSVLWQDAKTQGVNFAMVSPDARLVIPVFVLPFGSQKQIEVRDLPSGNVRARLDAGPPGTPHVEMDFSPDSRWILTLYLKTWGSGGGSFASMPFGKHIDVMGGGDQAWTGQVWEANSGKRHLELHGSSNALSHAFSPDGHYLAIGLREGTVQLWDVEHRQELFQWHAWSDRTAADSSPRHLAFTADSAALAVADTSSPTLRLLDLPRLRAELAQVGLDW